MTDKTIGQIWYTWSSSGLDDIRAGYRVRAASPHLINWQDRRYASIMAYLQYELPQGVNPNATAPDQAPINLTFAKTPYGNILVSKVYLGSDGVGRPGNYFAHLLAYMPQGFSAREAIELWGSPLWQKHDEPQRSTQLEELSVSDLTQMVPQKFHFAEVQQQLRQLIWAFLSPRKQQPRVQIAGSCQNILMLIWGLTHSLPKTLLRDLTFTTYERDPDKSSQTIVGTVTARELSAASLTETIMTIKPSTPADGDAAIDEYIAYAIECFDENENGQPEYLRTIIRHAEESNITTVTEFLELFQQLRDSQRINHPRASTPPTPSHPIKQVAPAPLSIGESRAQSTTTNIRTLVATLFVNVFQLGKQIAVRRSNRNYSLFALVVVLLLCTNAFTYCATTLHVQTDEAAIRATAFANGRSTLLAEQAQTVTAVAQREDGNDDGILIIYYPQDLKSKPSQPFTIYVVAQNKGTSTWSDERGYTLICVPPSDPNCQGAKVSGFFGGTVLGGQTYVLSITLSAEKPGSYNITLSLAHNRTKFGSTLQVPFVIQ